MKLNICNIPIKIIRIEESGYHLTVKAKINRKSATLLVDTGASQTVFDLTRIKKLLSIQDEDFKFAISPHLSIGLGTNSMESNMVVIDDFKLGDIVLKNYHSVALQMDNINKSYEMLGYKGIDGVIGSDFLKKYKATIYYNKKLLKLYF